MLVIRTILHPTDFSTHSEAARLMACALARDHRARVIVLHVVPSLVVCDEGLIVPLPVGDRKEEQEKLRRMCADVPGLCMEQRLVEGKPAAEIVGLAREVSCDLIVMGTHGRTGLERLLLGSVAEQVLRTAPCPVLTVRGPAPAGRPPQSLPEKDN